MENDREQGINIGTLRKEYRLGELDLATVSPNPIEQFREWFETALSAGLTEPNAMTLATCDERGFPSARTVLLKEFDKGGFVFFTNYSSRKGVELSSNPRAALLFYWPPLERQVRIEGRVEKVSDDESKAYFSNRPRGSQLGSAASPQSQEITSRSVLEGKLAELDRVYSGVNVERPVHWGGYRVVPERMEFWQGRENRLHDRIEYFLNEANWKIRRLAP